MYVCLFNSPGFTSSSFRTRSSSMSTTKADRAPKLTKSNKYERSKICQNIRQLKLGKRVIANFKTVVTTFGKDPPARTLGDSVWNGNESKADESLVKYEETARVCCPAIVRFLGKPSFAKVLFFAWTFDFHCGCMHTIVSPATGGMGWCRTDETNRQA